LAGDYRVTVCAEGFYPGVIGLLWVEDVSQSGQIQTRLSAEILAYTNCSGGILADIDSIKMAPGHLLPFQQ